MSSNKSLVVANIQFSGVGWGVQSYVGEVIPLTVRVAMGHRIYNPKGPST